MTAPSPWRAFAALLPVLRPERRGMLASYLIGTISALALAALSVLTAWGVGHAVVERAVPGPFWWIVVIGLVLARTVLTWQEMDVSHALAYRVLARLRMALFDSYARSVPGRNRGHSGRAAAVAMDDIEKLEFFYAHTLAQIATACTVFLAALITAIVLLPEAGLVMLFGSVVIGATSFLAGRRIRDLGASEQHERSELSTGVVDALGALREVLAYGLARRVTEDVLATTRRAIAVAGRRELLGQAVTAVRELAVTAVVIGVLAVSAHAAGVLGGGADPRFSAAALPALVALALAGVSATTDATTTLTQLHPLVASARRVAEGIHRPAVVTAPKNPRPVPEGPLGLRFADVSFAYDDRSHAVTRWTADIGAGEHVGLAGPSGTGKSTLIALAARLWDPSSGRIDLVAEDGRATPLDQMEDAQLRKAVALVDQEATLFHGTVRENLLRGTASVPDRELRAVLTRVGAAGWLDLDTDLGQGGLRLSGGQQARLCLARALVRKPRILLVDEVTASLDPETERLVSAVIADFEGTVLIASHRAETLGSTSRTLHLPARSA